MAATPKRRRCACACFDLDVDICIVGGGLAGLTVALEAARLGASIAVLGAGMSAGTRPVIISARLMPGFWNFKRAWLSVVPLEDAPFGGCVGIIGADYSQNPQKRGVIQADPSITVGAGTSKARASPCRDDTGRVPADMPASSTAMLAPSRAASQRHGGARKARRRTMQISTSRSNDRASAPAGFGVAAIGRTCGSLVMSFLRDRCGACHLVLRAGLVD